MRSAAALRDRWISIIPGMLARTGMYASTGAEMQLGADNLLEDLCFLDDRDAEYGRVRAELLRRYGQLGVGGPFTAMFGLAHCQAEVAAVYAEVFARLGYLAVKGTLSPARWGELTASLPTLFDEQDLRLSEAQPELGPASLVVDGRILCYASSRPADGWVFVDGHPVTTPVYQPGEGRFGSTSDDDPLVRSVRRSTGSFEDGLILTLYGRVLRWGPGWWIDHPSPTSSRESRAIATQLRQARDADPSQ
jgi:hypothetical protein